MELVKEMDREAMKKMDKGTRKDSNQEKRVQFL